MWRLWAFLAVLAATLAGALLALDRGVIRERLRKQQTADPFVLATARLCFAATLLLGFLDTGLLHFADTVPAAVSIGAFAALAAAFAFVIFTIRFNRFFVPAVRIQSERGHHVIDTGPYRFIRHPGYAGMILAPPAAGLALGSWIAFAAGVLCGATFLYRAWAEDRFLHANLPGYPDYARRTRFRLIPGLWCLLLLAAAAPLGAQDSAQAAPARPPARPFVEGGIYDRPYLTRLLGRTAIGGYAEAHARWEQVDGVTDEAGFTLKRWNIFTATQVSDFVRIGAELEFEEGGQDIKLEYAAIDVGIHTAFSIRGGMLLSPLGKFNLSHDSPRNEAVDRPFVSTDLLGVALSEPGFGAFGLLGLGTAGRVTYELYAVNGFNEGLIDRSPDGTRVEHGRSNFEDNNRSPAFVGRAAFSPRVGYEFGLSAHRGAWNVFRAEGEQVDERRNLTIGVVDAEATLSGFRFQGEAAIVRVDIPPGLTGIYSSRQQGMYLQVTRVFGNGWVPTMPSSAFTALARVDVVDFDTDIEGDTRRRATVGLNFRPTSDTAIKLDYVRGWSRDRFNNLAEEAGVLFSLATYF